MNASVFHGGVQLEPRKVPVKLPTARLAPLPNYAVPLLTRGGQFSEPRIAVGDAVLKGQLIAGGQKTVGIHAPCSGTITDIQAEGADRHISIAADDEQRAIEPRAALEPAEATLQQLREAGFVGMGGAGFPMADKLQAALNTPPTTLIINAVECEPTISCDAQLIAEDAQTVLFGADWLRRFVGATQCVIALEDHAQESFNTLQAALNTSHIENLRVAQLPTRYPAGSERQLVHAITGTELAPGARPLDGGVLVQNTASTHALGRWAQTGMPLTERLVTITGAACKNPQTLWAPIGAPVAALIAHAGKTDGTVELFQGGPVMGFSLANDQVAVAKHTQCIRMERPARIPDPLACIRCGLCAEACPEHLLPQQLHWQLQGDNLPGAKAERLEHCILCGCCDIVCPSRIPLSQQFSDGKVALRERQFTEQRAALAKKRVDARNARLEAKEREKKERLAKRKAAAAANKQATVAGAKARNDARKAVDTTSNACSSEALNNNAEQNNND